MNRKYLTKIQAENLFKNEIYPSLDKSDKPALRLAWHTFIDTLCKNGQISLKQYENWNIPRFIK